MATRLTPAERELERRRETERARNRRFRDRQRELREANKKQTRPVDHVASFPAAPDAPIHETAPLDELGGDPSAWARPAPAVAYAEPEPPPAPPDPEGAKKFASLVTLVFRLALDDAIARYDLRSFAAGLGAQLGPDDVPASVQAACAFVFRHAERCATKHGLGVALPYEDELVTLAAGGGGALYLLAKFTGRLDRRRPTAARSGPNGARDRAAPPSTADDDDDSAFSTLRIDAA